MNWSVDSLSGVPRVRPAPVRTCIGCRQRAARTDLVRLVTANGDHVVVDERRSAPGRGGWLHPSRTCLDLALRRGAVARALKAPGCDTASVVAWFTGEGHTS